MVNKTFKWVVNSCSDIAAIIIILMMFLTTADVTGRYVFNSPIIGAYDITEQLMIGLVFLAIAYVQSTRGHVKVEIATTWLPARAQLAVDVLGHVLGLVIMSLLTWRAGLLAWNAWAINEHTFGLVQIPLWPGRIVFCFGAGLLCIQFISDIIGDSVRVFSGVTKKI